MASYSTDAIPRGPESESHAMPAQRTAPVSLVAIANIVLRYGPSIALGSLVLALALAIPTLFGGRRYTANASFVPQIGNASGISGIAAQFGLLNAGADPAQSPAFYIELLKSREILGTIAELHYSSRRGVPGDDSTLVQRYGGTKVSFAARRNATIDHLREVVNAKSSPTTSIITITASDRSPLIATQIVQNLLARLNEFNLRRRQGQATIERQFAEARLAEVGGNLRAAESRLQQFLEGNRVRIAPELALEEDRLRRGIQMQQQLYNSLLEAYEAAKLNEVRENPVINTVDAPEVPVVPDGRGFIKRFAIGLLLGLFIGVTIAFAREYFRRVDELDPASTAELRRHARRMFFAKRHAP